jgi:transposase-like protein
MMTAGRRRTFTPEFKARTVELVRTSGKSVGEVCRELDLTETAVRRWVAQAEIDLGRRDEPYTASFGGDAQCGDDHPRHSVRGW